MAVALLVLYDGIDRKRTSRQREEQERQKAYARQLLETQESERRRISNDLHDSLGQSLLLIRAEARSAGDEDEAPVSVMDEHFEPGGPGVRRK